MLITLRGLRVEKREKSFFFILLYFKFRKKVSGLPQLFDNALNNS